MKYKSGYLCTQQPESFLGSPIPPSTIPDSKTIQVFTQYLAEMGKVKPTTCFVRKLNGKCFDRNELAKRFKSAIKCLKERRQSELSIHSGRHTAATQLLRTGADIAQVRDFLRHSSIKVTDMYAHAEEIKAMPMYSKEDVEKAEETAKENPFMQNLKGLLSDYREHVTSIRFPYCWIAHITTFEHCQFFNFDKPEAPIPISQFLPVHSQFVFL